MNKRVIIIILALVSFSIFYSCRKKGCTNPMADNYDPKAKADDGSCICSNDNNNNNPPTPYVLQTPELFDQYLPAPNIPIDNPLTVEGVFLGKKLFYDPILSGDNTLACAGCHAPATSFVDTNQFSIGIDMVAGNRNSMPLMNLAWNYGDKFFWDGRSIGLEAQSLKPVTDTIEMHETWVNAMSKLQAHPNYPGLFKAAFGTQVIDSLLVAKALAQFERTLITGDSKFDKFLRNELGLTSQELNGFSVYMNENKGDCFHCHGSPTNPLWTDNDFHNNGLDANFNDNGLGKVTGNPADNGKFKTPTLRNLVFTAPYMHDGRFMTIDQVIEHYSTGLKNSPTIDPLMKKVGNGGAQLTPTEKADLKAFLLTLTDSSFNNNPNYLP